MATMRYLVSDVSAAVAFYTGNLGFELVQQFGPNMAITKKGDLTLWLANLAAFVAQLKARGVKFRNEIVTGPGGSQILCDDPSGNCVELFQGV